MHVINVASSDISAAYMPEESQKGMGNIMLCYDTAPELSL